MEDHVHAVEQTELIVAQNSGVAGNDYMIWDSGRGYYLLNVVLPDGTVQLFLPEDVEQAAYYGYTFDGDDAWDYDEAKDSRVTQSVLALEYGVADPLIVRDEFWSGQQDFQVLERPAGFPELCPLSAPGGRAGAGAGHLYRGAAGLPVPRRRLAGRAAPPRPQLV